MIDLIAELKALKEKSDGRLRVDPGSEYITVGDDVVARFDKNAPAPQKRFVAALVNHLPTILAKLEEGERMREALDYLLDTRGCGDGRRPRIIDLCYTTFMKAKEANTEDGGETDWFNDTLPTVKRAIAQISATLESTHDK